MTETSTMRRTQDSSIIVASAESKPIADNTFAAAQSQTAMHDLVNAQRGIDVLAALSGSPPGEAPTEDVSSVADAGRTVRFQC